MPIFSYEAAEKSGRKLQDTIEGANEAEVKDPLYPSLWRGSVFRAFLDGYIIKAEHRHEHGEHDEGHHARHEQYQERAH